MNTKSNNLKVLAPLQFELLCEQDRIYENIIALKEHAESLFDRVSKIYRIFNEACVPSGIDDILFDVKLMGTGILVKMNRIASVAPKSIIGFAYHMPNGKIGHIALATYPDVVKLRDGMLLEVPVRGKAAWCGLVETFHTNFNKCEEICDSCSQSHEMVCSLLDKAESLGMIIDIYDATDFWYTRDQDSLKLACKMLKDASGRSHAV